MAKIRLLSDALINQIAAGEVVERPSSVVKELVENALDAGARSITVRLTSGGRERVEVEDDGSGMDADDALLALERHATSKIAASDDLQRITTLGFRGEALPSIAAASRLTLETAPAPGEGTRVQVDFGRILGVEPCSRPRGTRVVVESLFARLPARRKFLRTDTIELRHALGALTGLAFAHPETAFVVTHGQRKLLTLPAVSEVARRLPDLLGARRAREAQPVRHRAGALTIDGFLLPPAGAREVVIAINGRVVRDRLLVGAVNRALRGPGGLVEADAFLLLSLPLEALDVNVHPTKAEVRFADPGQVMAALAAALAPARLALQGPVEVRRVVTVPASFTAAGPPPAQTTLPWGREHGAGIPLVRETLPPFAPRHLSSPPAAPISTPLGHYIGQYRETYLLLEDDEGLLLVDQHVAHERVLFERLLASDEPAPAQRLLLPELVELTPAQAAQIEEAAGELDRLGLEVEAASGATLRILAVPAALPAARAAVLLQHLL
ncbi:MAG: DNA mismatch repair endonuclease MutL, partial [Acidobacteriota bacterium]